MNRFLSFLLSPPSALSAVLLPAISWGAPSFISVPEATTAIASVDLATPAGAAVMHAQWRFHDVDIVRSRFFAAGADGQPGTQAVVTQTLQPQAGGAGYDDSSWPTIAADSLGQRRSKGRTAFVWYRVRLTIPETVDDVATRGSTAVFETSLDDYAEVWVDGELPHAAGQSGGSVIAGWNAANRLVIGRDVQPGQQIQLAIFGANGPLSAVPTNYIYLHSARVSFHAPDVALPYAVPPQEVNVEVQRADPTLDRIISRNPKAWKLAEGFRFTEGPVYAGDHLLFSDPNANRIYRYSDAEGLSVFREPSGYTGADIAEYKQPGSNGLTLDAQGRLTIDQHGNRRVIRLEADGSETVLADADEGRRLNSPNDLVYKSDGALYFTDPPFGLPKIYADPRKTLPYSGVYRAQNGAVTLLTKELKGPNGIAFSPDEKFLYLGDWDDAHKVVMRYPVKADGTLAPGRVFADLTKVKSEDAIDGIKVDIAGNVYVSGPGGLWIFSSAGRHLGTIVLPRHPHNFAFGDTDGKSLYLCAQDRLYRMRLGIPGVRPLPAAGARLP